MARITSKQDAIDFWEGKTAKPQPVAEQHSKKTVKLMKEDGVFTILIDGLEWKSFDTEDAARVAFNWLTK
jgi:hypothetical protein